MKRMNRKSLILLITGLLIMSASFILRHYVELTDATDGYIKGVGLGFILLSFYYAVRQRKGTAS